MSMLGRMLGFGRNEHYDKGIRLFDQGIYEDAIEEFTLSLDGQNSQKDDMTDRLSRFYTAESYTHLGHAAMKRGNWKRSQECFQKALEIHPHYADLHFHLALAYRSGKEINEALASLERALAINPRFAKAYFYKGLVQYEAGNHAPAIASIEVALDLEPGFRTQALIDGMSCHLDGDYLSALQSFEKVSLTEVDDILFHYKLGDDLYRRGMLDEAIVEYQKSLTLNPNYADIHNHLGIAYNAKGTYTEAIREFERALSINPMFLDALMNLGILFRDQNRSAEARSCFQRATEIDPNCSAARDELMQLNAFSPAKSDTDKKHAA